MSKFYTYHVDGIHCINCSNGIKDQLKKKNISKIHVDIPKNTVSIQTDHYSETQVAKFLDEMGYKSQPIFSNPKVDKKLEYLLSVSLFLCLPLWAQMFFPRIILLHNPWFQLALCSPILFIGLLYFGRTAWYSILNGKPNMNVLILLGSLSAYLYSITDWIFISHKSNNSPHLFFETTATIITLVLLGNLLEKNALKKTSSSLESLEHLQIKVAKKEVDGQSVSCNISDIHKNDILLINQGDTIPIDSKIIWGSCLLDESMISGESLPVEKSLNDQVIGGTIIIEGSIKCLVNTTLNNTVLSQIIDRVKQAQENKPPIQKLGDRISHYFVPLVICIALLTFMVNLKLFDIPLDKSIMRAIAVLVISCPCAVGLATPTAVMVGVGRAAKSGILIKGGDTIESFAKTESIFIDKTGTLTMGEFKIDSIKKWNNTFPIESIIYELEKHSSHPLAKSILKEIQSDKSQIQLEDIQEIKGKGMTAKDSENKSYILGSANFTGVHDSELKKLYQIFLKINGELIAAFALKDSLKPEAKEALEYFNKQQIETILLSGDNKFRCDKIAQNLNFTCVFSEQGPLEKIEKINTRGLNNVISMVGDGINDAPALSKANVGISFGSASEIAIQSASILLLRPDLGLLLKSHQICKHTFLTIKQNLFWAFSYNLIAIPLASMGFLNPMFAALAMAFSDFVVIGNSIRLNFKNIEN